MTKRIVLIGTTATSMIQFRGRLIQRLREEGAEVYAFVSDYTDKTRTQVQALGAIPMDSPLCRSGLNPLSNIVATYKLSKQLKAIHPDAVLCYFAKTIVFGGIACRLAGIKRCLALMEGLGFAFTNRPEGLYWKGQLLKAAQLLLYRFVFPLLERVIFLNKDDEHDLVQTYAFKPKATSVIRGIGINLQEYPASKPPLEPITFLFVGRLLKDKGIREFVAAANQVKVQHPEARFIALGDYDPHNWSALTEVDLAPLNALQAVEFHGYSEDVHKALREASVFVLPSYREGLPRSTQEAMAIGRAVITTDAPGCRDTVIDGENGFLVPAFVVHSLAERMQFFIENPDQIQKMGQRSREFAENWFDDQKINDQFCEMLLPKKCL